MGLLWSTSLPRGWALGARNLVGRGPECVVSVDDPLLSGNHAVLTWKDGGWLVRDLGSRNGTFVEGRRLQPGRSERLEAGARLRFGGDHVLVLMGAGPPGPSAVVAQEGVYRESEGGMLVLPDDERPQVVVYEAMDGHWVIERDGDAEKLADGRRLLLDGRLWSLFLPSARSGAGLDTTVTIAGAASMTTLRLTFTVSQDEEHVDVVVKTGGRELPLRARVHHFAMLQLARARLADRAQGADPSEEGWVYADQLCRELGVETAVLNVQLLRARQQLAKAGVEGAGQLFERRRLSGQLRITATELVVAQAG